MDEPYLLRILDPLVIAGFEIGLQVGICHHLVVDSVTIFLLPDGIEKVKAGSHQDSIRQDGNTIGQSDIVGFFKTVDRPDVSVSKTLYSFGGTQESSQYLICRYPVWEKPVPLGKVTT